jgi:hypothetical protein
VKLQRLTIQNFLRVADLDLDLSGSGVHLFCGANEAGKSTVAESVRFALIGDTPRVRLKKNYPLLVTRGAKKGSVSLTFDGVTIQRDVRTGELKEPFKLTGEQLTAASIAFGAQAVVDLSPDDRRSLLFKLAAVKVTTEEIMRRMVADYDVPEKVAQRYEPSLKGGIDAGLKAAEADATRLRAKWSEITGETYGSNKAVCWKPEIAAGAKRPILTSPDDLKIMQERADAIEAQIESLHKAIGSETANEARRELLNADIARAKEAAAGLEAARKLQAELEASCTQKRDEVEAKVFILTKTRAAGKVIQCPSCDSDLQLSQDGQLEFADPDVLNYQGQNETQVAAELETLKRQLRDLVTRRDAAAAAVEAGQNAVTRVQDLTAALNGIVASRMTVDELKTERDTQRAALAQAKLAIAKAHEDNKTIAHLEMAEKAATEAHGALVITQRAIEALSPEGIKAELLEEVIGPINKRMEASAHLAGWLAPVLTSEMEVVREDGLPYELLSESAQWRLSAVVADAIASMSGVKVLILDRMDVLGTESRGEMIRWAQHLAETDFDTVLIMATLKAPPKIHDVAVHWLSEGAAKEAA